jgi:hypothetical protein
VKSRVSALLIVTSICFAWPLSEPRAKPAEADPRWGRYTVENIDGLPARGDIAVTYTGGVAVGIPILMDIEPNCNLAQYKLDASGNHIVNSYKGQCADLEKELAAVRQILIEGASLKFDAPINGQTHQLTITSPSGHTVFCLRPLFIRTD